MDDKAIKARRRILTGLSAVGALLGQASAQAAEVKKPEVKKEHFPGDPPEHHIVYQLNHADAEYIEHILNSISAMLTKYEDNVSIVVVAFAQGIHLLAKNPKRSIPLLLRQRVRSQALEYKIQFIACRNTMSTLGWDTKDMVDFAQIEQVGAASIMELQEKGYAYIAW